MSLIDSQPIKIEIGMPCENVQLRLTKVFARQCVFAIALSMKIERKWGIAADPVLKVRLSMRTMRVCLFTTNYVFGFDVVVSAAISKQVHGCGDDFR